MMMTQGITCEFTRFMTLLFFIEKFNPYFIIKYINKYIQIGKIVH